MKVLYAIQGTGNGHISRAREITPILQKKCDLDILVSGYQSQIDLPFEVTYTRKGLSFMFGNQGGIDFWQTYIQADTPKLLNEILDFPIEQYDLVINDFEPVSAWACFKKDIPCIGLSHQSAVIHKKSPRPKKIDLFGEMVLKNYAPTKISYGFHFLPFSPKMNTPVIRSEIRTAQIENYKHYTVYLPAYETEYIIEFLSRITHITWHIFSKHIKTPYINKNIHVFPVQNDLFLLSFTTCEGIISGAGFETPAEAIFMGKKLLVIPMKNQYEQQCNAAALKQMSVPVIKNLKEKHFEKVCNWVNSKEFIHINYPDNTETIIDEILENHKQMQEAETLHNIANF